MKTRTPTKYPQKEMSMLSNDEWLCVIEYLDIQTICKSAVFIKCIAPLFEKDDTWETLVQRDFTQQQITSATGVSRSNILYRELHSVYKSLPYLYPPVQEEANTAQPGFSLSKVLMNDCSSLAMSLVLKMLMEGKWIHLEGATMVSGLDFQVVRLVPRPNQKVPPRKIQIWATGPLKSITTSYFRGANLVFCPYDASDPTNTLVENDSRSGSLGIALGQAEQARKYTNVPIVVISVNPSGTEPLVSDKQLEEYCKEKDYLFRKISEDSACSDTKDLIRLVLQLHTPPETQSKPKPKSKCNIA